jgi:CRISPR system Cascade subunit CasE
MGRDMNSLTLLQTQPDLNLLFQWASSTGQAALRDDLGYALHASARAVLGTFAPKPFALMQRPHGPAVFVGYTVAEPEALDRAAAFSATDPLAADALGLGTLRCRRLPDDWRVGERLRFEVRAAPVVRSRIQPGGGYPEIDVARHPSFGGEGVDREQAYIAWLAREVARGGAAVLRHAELAAFTLSLASRRASAEGGRRDTRRGMLPDVLFKGELEVCDREAFHRLLARGIGRHRAFGFGCLLLSAG